MAMCNAGATTRPRGFASAGLIFVLVLWNLSSIPPHAEADAQNENKKDDGDEPYVKFSHGKKVCTKYSVIEMRGDGRCLFRALAYGAYLKSGRPPPTGSLQTKLADILRAEVADEFIKRRKETEWYVGLEVGFDKYVSHIRRSDAWGGEPELIMASHVLQMPIIVYIRDGDANGLISIAEYGQEYNRQYPIEVLYDGVSHYDVLQIPRRRGIGLGEAKFLEKMVKVGKAKFQRIREEHSSRKTPALKSFEGLFESLPKKEKRKQREEDLDLTTDNLETLHYPGVDLISFVSKWMLLLSRDLEQNVALANQVGGVKFSQMTVSDLSRSFTNVPFLLPILSSQEKALAKFKGIDSEKAADLQGQFDRTFGDIHAIRSNLKDAESHLSNLEKEVKEIQAAKEAHDVLLSQLKAKNDQLDANISKKDAEISACQGHLFDREKALGDAQSAKKTLEGKLDEAKARTSDMFLKGFKEACTQILHFNPTLQINMTQVSTGKRLYEHSFEEEEDEDNNA